MSGETPVRRNRSAWGPTYFGPGKSGVACEYGQNDSQIVHFTQWSRESRTNSVTKSPYELGHEITSRIAEAAAYPEARLRPLPEASRHGTAPARVAPAAWRFS